MCCQGCAQIAEIAAGLFGVAAAHQRGNLAENLVQRGARSGGRTGGMLLHQKYAAAGKRRGTARQQQRALIEQRKLRNLIDGCGNRRPHGQMQIHPHRVHQPFTGGNGAVRIEREQQHQPLAVRCAQAGNVARFGQLLPDGKFHQAGIAAKVLCSAASCSCPDSISTTPSRPGRNSARLPGPSAGRFGLSSVMDSISAMR